MVSFYVEIKDTGKTEKHEKYFAANFFLVPAMMCSSGEGRERVRM